MIIMRTTLALDDSLLDRAKRRAAEQGTTLGHYVEDALREYLTAPKRGVEPVDLPVFEGGKLHAGIDPSANRALYDALDDTNGRDA